MNLEDLEYVETEIYAELEIWYCPITDTLYEVPITLERHFKHAVKKEETWTKNI